MSRRSLRPGEWLVAALLLWLVVEPLAVTTFATLGPEHRAAWHAFLSEPSEWTALVRSVWISAASVVLAGAIGVPLAFLFARVAFPGRRILGELVALPVALPPLVGVLAFLYLYGESGFATRAVAGLFGFRETPWRLTGWPAILLVHAYSMYVYFYLFVRAALSRLDPAMDEAAASLGAGRLRRLTSVILPLLSPALAGAAVLVFLTSIGSFSAPYLFGGSFRVMTTEILAAKQNGDLAVAEVDTVVLAIVALACLGIALRLERSTSWTGGARGAARPAVAPQSAAVRRGIAIAAWIASVVLLLPHAALVLLSFVPASTWTTQAFPPVLSVRNYTQLFGSAEALRPVWNSLWMTVVSTVGAIALGFLAARLAARKRKALPRFAELSLSVPWAVPATAFAFAVAAMMSVSKPWAGRFLLVGTAAILPLVYLVRALPTTGRAALAALRRLDPGLEEAAASLGAGAFRRTTAVVLPVLAPALAAGASLAFLNSFGDFASSILLYTYETRPIAIEILSRLRLEETGFAAAYGVLLSGLAAGAFLLWGRERT